MVDWTKIAKMGGDALSDLGFGLTQGNNLSSSLQAAGRRTAQMEAPRAQAELQAQQEQERQAAIAKQQEGVNQTAKMLADKGYADLAALAQNGYGDQAIAQYFDRTKPGGGIKPTSDIQNFQFAQQNGFTGSFQDWVASGGGSGGGVNYGVNPTYFKDPTTGKVMLGQLGDNGSMTPTTGIPEGYEPITPMDLSMQKAAGTALGKGGGNAALEIPAAKQLVDRVALQVEDLKKDPGLDEMFGGFMGSPLPNQWLPPFPNSKRARAQSKIDQLSGESFLAARQMLKGGGQITDFEGKRAEAAFARMSQAQNKADFTKALDEFVTAVGEGVAKLEAQAGMGGVPMPGGGSPTPGAPGAAPAAGGANDPFGMRF